jgi:hypothetical protein
VAGSVTRPAPPYPARAGYRWVVFEDPDWRLLEGQHTKRCRNWRAHRGAGPLAVAELKRHRWTHTGRRVPQWWAYCADHLYGRWVEGGHVLEYRLEELEA